MCSRHATYSHTRGHIGSSCPDTGTLNFPRSSKSAHCGATTWPPTPNQPRQSIPLSLNRKPAAAAQKSKVNSALACTRLPPAPPTAPPAPPAQRWATRAEPQFVAFVLASRASYLDFCAVLVGQVVRPPVGPHRLPNAATRPQSHFTRRSELGARLHSTQSIGRQRLAWWGDRCFSFANR